MKIIRIIFFLTLISCSNNREYFEDPIEFWLKENLNDNESYEPIEFEVVNELFLKNYSKSIILSLDLELAFSNLETALEVKLNKLDENFDLKKIIEFPII